MFEKYLVLLWIFHFCVVLVRGQYQGDQCTTPAYQPGVCNTIQKCTSIFNDLKQGKRNHGVCGFEGFGQIVCCPIVITPVTTPVTQTHATSRAISEARISVKKCNEYKEFAYNKVYFGNVFGADVVEKKVSNCAFTSVALIVGGIEAKQREFPHMALIGYRDSNTVRWECGGTLISDQFVLTAGHCFDSLDFGPARYVRLGDHDLSRTDEATHVDLNIIQRISHPDYKYTSQYNDIGLLKLERRVQLNGAIRPACLPEKSAVPTSRAIASGWGTIQYKGSKSNVLRRVVLEMFSQQECNSMYSSGSNQKVNKGIVEETQVCAGSKTEEKDTCQGDSGGPLQVYHPTHSCTYTIVGVTSFGIGCGTVGSPGVYTRVYAYLSWIEGVVWPNEK